MVRLRNRYVLMEYSLPQDKEDDLEATVIRSNSVMSSLNTAIRHLHGVQGVGLAKAGLLVKYINNSTRILIMRMRRSAYEIVCSSLPFIRQVDGKSISFRTIYTGATIRQCNLFLLKYQRRKLEEKYGSLNSDLQRTLFEQELTSLKPLTVQIG